LMREARSILAGAVAIDRALARRVESLPGDPCGVAGPRLFRLGVATGGLALLDDLAARLSQPRIDLVQLVRVFDLDTEMIEADIAAAAGDREIDAGVVQHPFRVVGLHH